MDMNTCCAYFCTGMSIFGVAGLLFMYGILTSGGEWFLNPRAVNEADWEPQNHPWFYAHLFEGNDEDRMSYSDMRLSSRESRTRVSDIAAARHLPRHRPMRFRVCRTHLLSLSCAHQCLR